MVGTNFDEVSFLTRVCLLQSEQYVILGAISLPVIGLFGIL